MEPTEGSSGSLAAWAQMGGSHCLQRQNKFFEGVCAAGLTLDSSQLMLCSVCGWLPSGLDLLAHPWWPRCTLCRWGLVQMPGGDYTAAPVVRELSPRTQGWLGPRPL